MPSFRDVEQPPAAAGPFANITTHEPSKVFSRATYDAATPEPGGEALKSKLKTLTEPRKAYCK